MGTRQVKGVGGGYKGWEVGTRGGRWVQGRYKGCKGDMRQIQGCEVGTRQLKGV